LLDLLVLEWIGINLLLHVIAISACICEFLCVLCVQILVTLTNSTSLFLYRIYGRLINDVIWYGIKPLFFGYVIHGLATLLIVSDWLWNKDNASHMLHIDKKKYNTIINYQIFIIYSSLWYYRRGSVHGSYQWLSSGQDCQVFSDWVYHLLRDPTELCLPPITWRWKQIQFKKCCVFYLEFRTLDKVQNCSDPECYTPS
jgi:hypothetical protein